LLFPHHQRRSGVSVAWTSQRRDRKKEIAKRKIPAYLLFVLLTPHGGSMPAKKKPAKKTAKKVAKKKTAKKK
jgi:hypothetical protein